MEREVFVITEEPNPEAGYLERFFTICSLLREKMEIIRCIKKKQDQETLEKLQKLNREIIEKKYEFWQWVEDNKEGKSFVLEEIFSALELDREEKEIILFLFYLKINELQNIFSIPELVAVLDCSDNPLERVKKFNYFSPLGRLIKNKLIVPYKEYRKADLDYIFNDAFFFLILDSLCTSRINQNIKEEIQKGEKNVIKVGFLKDPEYSLDDIVIDEQIKQDVIFLLKSCKKQNGRFDIYEKIKKGKSLSFLFYGPPGTGKSMLAEAIAHFLQKKVLIVEFSKVTSFLFGETDKNIARIFQEGRENDAVIVIDEADAILYSREYAQWEHDIRFVNIMLQELERFEGVIIFTTNMEILLDHALERRIALKVKFDLPDENRRLHIWKWHIPEKIQLADDVNFSLLAQRYEFSGGNIKNAVMNALRKMLIEDREELRMEDLIYGAELEKKGMLPGKRGKTITGFAEAAYRMKGR